MGLLLALVAIAVWAPFPHDDGFCKKWDAFDQVQRTGKVGELAPALNAFVFGLPTGVPAGLRAVGTKMASSWNLLYTTYLRNGGDATVPLQVDGVPPRDIGGITVEWQDSFDRTAGRRLFDYAANKCGPPG
ncbi:MAG: hypothetical protein JWQ74_130 [Marmoricola sp.]|nr:hypothetical protein [Marmoricola sp.]